MDDEELMGRLSATRPSIAPRSGPLHAALEEVVTDSRHQRRRRKRFVFTGVTLSVILLGGGSAAIASPSVLTWLGFVPDKTLQHFNAAGDFCAAGIIIHPEGVPVSDPSFLAARAILLDINFDALVIPEDIGTDQGYSEREAAKIESIAQWNAANPDATMQPGPPDPETDMLFDTAYRLITDGVTSQGLDTSSFSLEGAGECDAVSP